MGKKAQRIGELSRVRKSLSEPRIMAVGAAKKEIFFVSFIICHMKWKVKLSQYHVT